MRVVLVTRSFRARSPFDPASHVRSLAPALARSGAATEVFCAMRGSGLAPLAQRRAVVLDHVGGVPFGVTALEVGAEGDADGDAIAAAFGTFLDRERPDVVHIESLEAFGCGLVREIRARGIASVLCASDTWAAHDRGTQTLPDLTPFDLGDQEAEARAQLAEEELGTVPASGRFDDPSKDARLKELLHEPLAAMNDVLRLRDARECVELRRATKRVALSGVDRRFATSRLLSKELSAAVGRAFTFRAAGVDTSLFNAPTVQEAHEGPTRFVFIGTSAPTSGIDTLLDAYGEARLEEGAPTMSLALWLEAGDPARDAEVAERADLLRIETRWSRGAVDVVGALGEADVLVMPSLWGEVQPSLCRVALAAGRPLVASRTPGIVEALSSSAARLVAPGDVGELRAELLKLAEGGDALADLTRGAVDAARTTKSTDDEAREWIDTYARIAEEAGGRTEPVALPAVQAVAETFAELEKLSVAELFERAQEGVAKLRTAFGLADSAEELLVRVVARGGDARDRAGQLAGLRAELSNSLADLSRAREAMRREEAERAGRVADLQGVLGQYEIEVKSRGEEAARAVRELREATDAARELEERAAALEAQATALETENAGLEAEKAGLEGERASFEEARRALEDEKRELETRRETAATELEAAKGRFEALAKEAERVRESLTRAEAERTEFEQTLAERDALVGALRERLGAEVLDAEVEAASTTGPGLSAVERDLEGIEAFCVALEQDARTLESHDAWLRSESQRLLEALGTKFPAGDAGESDERAAFERGYTALETLRAELDWRRREMEAARAAGSSLRVKVLAGPLSARVRDWDGAAARFRNVPDDRHAEKEPDEPRIEREAENGTPAEAPEAALPKGGTDSQDEPAPALADGSTEADEKAENEAQNGANDR